MNAARHETFLIEVPEQSDTDLVRVFERSGGREVYIGIALDLSDDLDEGEYRAALTESEAHVLHAALGAALAEAPDQS